MSFFPQLVTLISAALALVALPSFAYGEEAPASACPKFASGEIRGRIASERLKETSGIAASQRNPGVYYLHNDSGNRARVFAIDETGRDLGAFMLSGARQSDWEDIAVGSAPNEAGTFIYVADTGDNDFRRRWVTIYRVPEPAVDLEQPGGSQSISEVVALKMQYPGQTPRDAEALLIDPRNSDLYIITKERRGPARIYRYAAPHRPEEVVVLEELGTLQLGPSSYPGGNLVTSGDISLERNQIVIRTYSHVFLWNRAPGQSIADAITGPPCTMPHSREPQGEAICWTLDESGYLTVSEKLHQPLYFFARTPP